jgi:hypothetical protein
MPVHKPPSSEGRARSPFVVCDKRPDINRVTVPAEQIAQWRCDLAAVRAFVAASLGVAFTSRAIPPAGPVEIGVARGRHRTQMLALDGAPVLKLIAGGASQPLMGFVNFERDRYSLDAPLVQALVDSSSTSDERYTPNTTRREERKLETAALHEQWRRELRALKKRRPGMSAVWYAQQIARQSAGGNRRPETIRRVLARP